MNLIILKKVSLLLNLILKRILIKITTVIGSIIIGEKLFFRVVNYCA